MMKYPERLRLARSASTGLRRGLRVEVPEPQLEAGPSAKSDSPKRSSPWISEMWRISGTSV
jgi:hypothetical protein